MENRFRKDFGSKPIIAKAPGRINVIGEHTDYNDGFVLPAAIDKYGLVAVGFSGSSQCEVHAADLNESFSFRVDDVLLPTSLRWANYFLGIVDQFLRKGSIRQGINVIFSSDVPMGAGISSSAALECSFALALNELTRSNMGLTELATIGQKAERNFIGVQCGIMDQLASLLGARGQVLLIDCRSKECTFIPLHLRDFTFVLFNTGVSHSLADTEYNIRRFQCAEGVELLHSRFSGISSLRDATPENLKYLQDQMDPMVLNRCKYVIAENLRVGKAVDALKAEDALALGSLMFESHKGLREQYEVSCTELDFLVDSAYEHPHIWGARMMGAGFGGCTINLIQKEYVDESIEAIGAIYKKRFGLEMTPIKVEISDGARIVD